MRIGEVANQLGVSADTIRFYERSGLLPPPTREVNGYREYTPAEIERLRLLLDLRRLDLPLDEAARLAGWCQSGHCAETTAELPQVIAAKRAELRERIRGLQELDGRLEALERHLSLTPLPMAGETAACCAAAAAVLSGESSTSAARA
ncbi:MAG TPA: MerR family transcriptional regulator [candidate division Zixibacteria bacterium]|nr:MerR family transcriptional regulator [candidate division Zixibacteria bacterium]